MIPPDSQGDSTTVVKEPKFLRSASFSVSSRVALQLGRESISSSITAVVELVKNAYDADAEEVRIRFAYLGTPDALMIVEDTGDGMTLDDLLNRWMVIGTDYKVAKRTTGKQRAVTGEKGLGRLGLDRLCTRTTIESKKAGATTGVRLEINWQRYEANTSRIETVEHDLFEIPDLCTDPIINDQVPYEKGTRLVLRGLKDAWTLENLIELQRDLALLVSPFSGPKDFAIYINSGMPNDRVDGRVEVPQSLLDKCDWHVIASLDAEGLMDILMTSPRHEAQFKMPPTPWDVAMKGMGTIPQSGPLKMEFYFFIRRDSELDGQTLRASDLTAFIKNNQGIRIYRDGFRVKPYGEPDGSGDWLRLAYRRMQNPEAITQKGWRVGYNQVVGAVFIKHEDNPGLNDQTNREGLLVGQPFAHLKAFSGRVIRFFEQKAHLVRYEQKSASKRASDKAESSIEETETAIAKIEDIVSQLLAPSVSVETGGATVASNVEIQRGLAETKEALELAKTELQESKKLYQRVEAQKDTMANLASLGILAASFGHETVNWSGNAVANARALLQKFANNTVWILPDELQSVETRFTDLIGESEKVWNFARFTIGNLNRRKRQKALFDVKAVVKRVFTAFSDVIEKQKRIHVNFSAMPSGDCNIEGFEIDAESMIVNFITNSIWALSDKIGDDRNIVVSLSQADKDWELIFDDSGIGLEAGDEEAIFLPGHTTKRNDHGEFVGTGMGLFIVKSFVEEHFKGTITALAKGPSGGARFIVRLPRAIEPDLTMNSR